MRDVEDKPPPVSHSLTLLQIEDRRLCLCNRMCARETQKMLDVNPTEEKVAILRRHLLDKVPVSDLCGELGLQPTVFYRWQKEFFENGAAALQSTEPPRRQAEEKQKRIEFLEKKVQTKDEVLAELMAEHIALKKSLGEL